MVYLAVFSSACYTFLYFCTVAFYRNDTTQLIPIFTEEAAIVINPIMKGAQPHSNNWYRDKVHHAIFVEDYTLMNIPVQPKGGFVTHVAN